ncbi:GTP-sensing pleiotropic transcriptional regulator CodY [Paenibacillus yanchengensis]|uniref:Global transcriptional regulator CodY n=1 Tax=Paenibacillus yanchengensis TaxID=2035833 RepID=A0ABW4YMR1_9BACL
MSLLLKTRTLNRLLQKAAGKAVNFKEMAEVLSSTITATVFVVSRKGKILGCAAYDVYDQDYLRSLSGEQLRFSEQINERFLDITESIQNIVPDPGIKETFHTMIDQSLMTIVPISGGGKRLGTLIITRADGLFSEEDLILAEYGSTIVGMEIIRERTEEMEQEIRSRTAVSVAVGSLSFSEHEAVENIFEELDGKEGLLVASKVADRAGITRSVIVNALRKLESAGVIETRSLGMKGTYIKILNQQLLIELEKKN